MIASKERRRISPRSRGAVAAQSAWAATAASSAASASVVSPSATSVITDSSAGAPGVGWGAPGAWVVPPPAASVTPASPAGSWPSTLLRVGVSRRCPPMKRPRDPVFARRSSPVMDSACHSVKFVESVHAVARTLTLLTYRPGGMHPDDTEPLADPMPRGARLLRRWVSRVRARELLAVLTAVPPRSWLLRGPPPLELAARQELFGPHDVLAFRRAAVGRPQPDREALHGGQGRRP